MDVFTALSDPTRRKIVELLAQRGQLTAGEISEQFPVSPQAISQHLKALRDAELVRVEKRAQQRIYQVNAERVAEVENWAAQLRQQAQQVWEQRFDALDAVLKAELRNAKGENDERE